MEMSGFARHEGSVPIIGDIGDIWPLMGSRVAAELGLDLQFISYPQQTDAGKSMRDFIVRDIRSISRDRMLAGLNQRTGKGQWK